MLQAVTVWMGHGEGLGHGLADRWEGSKAQCLGVLPLGLPFFGSAFGFWRGFGRRVCAAPDVPPVVE